MIRFWIKGTAFQVFWILAIANPWARLQAMRTTNPAYIDGSERN